jgi:hypothetical protein
LPRPRESAKPAPMPATAPISSTRKSRPMNPNSLMDLFRANKFVLVAYTGLGTRLNTTKWYICLSAPWARLRHHIEAFGLEACEDEAMGRRYLPLNGRPTPNTIIRGFTVYRVMRDYKTLDQWPQALKDLTVPETVCKMPLPEAELKGSEWALPNTFIFVVRAPLPWGARPYVPIEERSKYALLQERAEYDSEDAELRVQMAALKEQAADAWHAADRTMLTAQMDSIGEPFKVLGPSTGDPAVEHPGLKVASAALYSVPPMDYLCPTCREFGKHYAEACWLFSEAARSGDHTRHAAAGGPKSGLQFGAKKFGAARTATADDATFYALLHKRAVTRQQRNG